MGSFRASLELGGKSFDVLYSSFNLNRNTTERGMPSSSVDGGQLVLRVDATADTSLIEAMVNSQFKAIEGKVIFKKTEEDSKMKEIEFKNAYIVKYRETLDVESETPMTILFTISAEEITVGNATHFNRWSKNS